MVAALGVAIAAGLAGCATEEKKPKRIDETADSLGDVRIEATAAKKQLDATTAALGKLVGQAEGSLRPAFETYMKELARLQVQADRARSRADDLHARAEAYVTTWHEDAYKLKEPEPRKESEARRAKVKASIAGIQSAARAAGDAYRPLLQDLLDIQKALGVDLTEAGIAAVTPTADRAIEDAAELQGRLDAFLAELNRLRDSLGTRS
jgi:chromosome segregation ATPase